MALLYYDNINIRNSSNNTRISLSISGDNGRLFLYATDGGSAKTSLTTTANGGVITLYNNTTSTIQINGANNGEIQLGTTANGKVNILSTKVGEDTNFTHALMLASTQNFTLQDGSGNKTLLLNYNGGEFYSFGTVNEWDHYDPNDSPYKVKISGFGLGASNNFGFIVLRDKNNNSVATLTAYDNGGLYIGNSSDTQSVLTNNSLTIGGSAGSILTNNSLTVGNRPVGIVDTDYRVYNHWSTDTEPLTEYTVYQCNKLLIVMGEVTLYDDETHTIYIEHNGTRVVAENPWSCTITPIDYPSTALELDYTPYTDCIEAGVHVGLGDTFKIMIIGTISD